MIPQIIHQTYKNQFIPEGCHEYQRNLREIHHDWSYRFYDDEQCHFIIKNELPELLEIYEEVPFPIMRADIFRVAIVYLYGGFYFDLDVDFHHSLHQLCEKEAVFAVESILSENESMTHNHLEKVRIANYGFGSSPGHPFLESIIRNWQEKKETLIEVTSERKILESTGPGLFTTLYHQALPHQVETIYLLSPGSNICPKCQQNRCQFGSYASHLHMGSWRWE